jgi:hypothetical protein
MNVCHGHTLARGRALIAGVLGVQSIQASEWRTVHARVHALKQRTGPRRGVGCDVGPV